MSRVLSVVQCENYHSIILENRGKYITDISVYFAIGILSNDRVRELKHTTAVHDKITFLKRQVAIIKFISVNELRNSSNLIDDGRISILASVRDKTTLNLSSVFD